MTAHGIHHAPTATHLTGSGAREAVGRTAVGSGRGILGHIWRVVLEVAHGIDAGALVAHGRPVPADHPARRRALDHEEVERRLDELYPRR